MTANEFASTVADAVDRRRGEISQVLRVVATAENTVLEQTASTMALPVLYAHWEGFVKETVGSYIEFIEKQELHPHQTHPTVFSFAMRKRLKGLISSGSLEKLTDFASWIAENATNPIHFEDKAVNTAGNLSYKNLKELCDSLKIDVARLASEQKKIDALVNRRNNIAHTGRPQRFGRTEVTEDAQLVLKLIESFETILVECASTRSFKAPLAA